MLDFKMVQDLNRKLVEETLVLSYISTIKTYDLLLKDIESNSNITLENKEIEKNHSSILTFVDNWKKHIETIEYQRVQIIRNLFNLLKEFNSVLFTFGLYSYFIFDNRLYKIDENKFKFIYTQRDFNELSSFMGLEQNEKLNKNYVLSFKKDFYKGFEVNSKGDETVIRGIKDDLGFISVNKIQIIDIENCLGCGGEHKSFQVIDNVFYCPNSKHDKKITVSQDK